MTPKLKEKLKELPREPGVYFHKNRDGEVIYVGKAAILRNRVRQYFQSPERKDAKTRALVAEIDDTDWIVVDTEMDALFLESEMIKRYMPKWNILLRDDKTVSYVRIDMKSEVPYVTMTRNPEDDGAEYFGPYYGKTAITRALRILRKIFPYYDRPYTGRKTLNTDLGLTPGIEVGKMTARDYKHNLRRMISYLKGNRKRLVRDVEKLMYEAAANGEYEKAAAYRNQFFGLKGLVRRLCSQTKNSWIFRAIRRYRICRIYLELRSRRCELKAMILAINLVRMWLVRWSVLLTAWRIVRNIGDLSCASSKIMIRKACLR